MSAVQPSARLDLVVPDASKTGVLAGVRYSRLDGGAAGMDDVLLLAATELTADTDIARLAEVLR